MSINTYEQFNPKLRSPSNTSTRDSENIENKTIFEKAINTEKSKKNNRPLSIKDPQQQQLLNSRCKEPYTKNNSGANSDDLKSYNLKKSKLTLPNRPTPLPRTYIVSDEVDVEESGCKVAGGLGLPNNKQDFGIVKTDKQARDKTIIERDAQTPCQKSAHHCVSSSSSLKKRCNNKGHSKSNLKQKMPNDQNLKEENAKFHEIWSILRYMNAHQFRPTPRISEESLVPKKRKIYRRRIIEGSKSPPLAPRVSSERNSCRENMSLKVVRNGMKPNKLEENNKTTALISNNRFNITKNIYLNTSPPLLKEKRIRKTPNLAQTNNPTNMGRVCPWSQMRNVKSNLGNGKNQLWSVNGERRDTDKFFQYSTSSPMDSDISSLNTGLNGSYLKQANVKVMENTKNISTNLNESFGSSKCGGPQLKDACKNGNVRSRLSKLPPRYSPNLTNSVDIRICSSDNLCGSIRSGQHKTANKRKLRLNTTIPTPPIPKLTLTEIKRKIGQIHFPIVVLGKNELSSTIEVPDYDPVQFDGLKNHIWPFMKNWVRRKSSSVSSSLKKGGKAQLTTGEVNAKSRRDFIQHNKQMISRKIKDNALKFLFQKTNECGDYNLKKQSRDFDKKRLNTEYPFFDDSMIPKPIYSSPSGTRCSFNDSRRSKKSPRAQRDSKQTRNVGNIITNYEGIDINTQRHTKNIYGDVHYQPSRDINRRDLNMPREKPQIHKEDVYISSLYRRGQHSPRNQKMCTSECNTLRTAHSPCDSMFSARNSIITVRDECINTEPWAINDSTYIDEVTTITTVEVIKRERNNKLEARDRAPKVKCTEHTSASVGEFKNIGKKGSETDSDNLQSAKNSEAIIKDSNYTLKDNTSRETVRSSKRRWRITKDSKSLINSESKQKPYFPKNAFSNLPARSQTNSKSKDKRASIIVKNAIRMLELGFFHNGELYPEQNREVHGNASVDTLVEKDVETKIIESNSTRIPGFENTNSLSDIEIKTMNEYEVSICNEDITIQFDVVDTENSEVPINKDISELKVFQNSDKVLKCKLSVFNPMLPAELCTMVPTLMRNMTSSKEKIENYPPKQNLLPLTESLESKLNRTPPKVLPFIISPELIKYREGRYTKIFLNQFQTKHFAKEISNYLYSMHNVIVPQEILSQVDAAFLIVCALPVISKLFAKGKITKIQTLTPEDHNLTALRSYEKSLMNTSEYFLNKMMEILNTHKIMFDFIYDFSSDVMDVKVNISNKTSNAKSLVPFTKNIEESLTITNFKISSISSIYETNHSGEIFPPDLDVAFGEIKILPYEKDIVSASDTSLRIEEIIEDIGKLIYNELNPRTISKVSFNVPVKSAGKCHDVESHSNQVAKGFNVLFKRSNKSSRTFYKKCRSTSSIIYTPLSKINKLDDFFKAMGAVGLSAAIDGNTSEKLISSIMQMRVWISEITPRQALLVLLLINKMQTPNLTRFRPILLQAIAVNRITKACDLDTEIDVLEKESFNLTQSQNDLMNSTITESSNDLYEELCWIAKTTASDYQKTFDESSERLLKTLLAKKKKLNPSYLRVMARYVGLGLLKSPNKSD